MPARRSRARWRRAPREFDDVYRGVVAAGEQSGALGIVLERLADDLEARQELKAR